MLAEDIESALNEVGILEKFQSLPPSHQNEYLKYIEEAKKSETRANRIQKTIEMLRSK